jgi:hypothetical protein
MYQTQIERQNTGFTSRGRYTAVYSAFIRVDFQHRAGPASIRHPFLETDKGYLIYRRTGNLRSVQLSLGHTKIESTIRYLGIEVDDALR